MNHWTHTVNPELDLVLERELPVAAARVYEAWTTPESLKQWFCPKPYETTECDIDLRPGGAFRTVMRSPEGVEMENVGCYLQIVPGELLVWTSSLLPGYRPSGEEFLPFTAVLDVEALADDRCRYTAIAIHGDAEGAKKHADMGFHEGWGTVVDQLVEHLATA